MTEESLMCRKNAHYARPSLGQARMPVVALDVECGGCPPVTSVAVGEVEQRRCNCRRCCTPQHRAPTQPPRLFCLPAYPSRNAFQSKPSTTQHPHSGTGCTMMAKGVEETATSATAHREGERRKRRRSTTWNKCEGMLFSRLGGNWSLPPPHLSCLGHDRPPASPVLDNTISFTTHETVAP